MDSIAVIASALITLFGTLMVGYFQRRFNATEKQLDQIHVLVNSRLTEALEDIRLLKAELIHEKLKANETLGSS